MKFASSILIVLASGFAFADPKPWMKQSNPDSLGLFVWVSNDCPFEKSLLKNRIEGEFLRARVKPSENLYLNLTVNVKCMPALNRNGDAMGHTVSYEIRYGTRTADGTDVLYELPDHGSMLIGGEDTKQFYVDAIRDSTSQALTDYLQANFE